MAPKFPFFYLLIAFLFLTIQPFVSQSRILKSEDQTLKSLQILEEVHKGQTIAGLNKVKKYLNKFGFYANPNDSNLTDDFDDHLESALKTYQKYYHLNITGSLNSNTIKKMMIPRCGVPDDITNLTSLNQSLYNFPSGFPRWSEFELTYSFSSSVPDDQDFRSAFAQAFQSWEGASQFKFKEASADETVNIVIGFYSGDHGDGVPFDGPGRVLAHSFFPQDGRSHYDADESWSTNPDMNHMDLESVALHELGHVLGLAHSQDPNAVMHSGIAPGTIKRDLTQDDIQGIQALYPN
ncbi:hypothetical protein P3X46_032444 [Hevea brasiliensis]|uniref:Peptidase metallopeptidase domain-containing protein n=2 Tax=Hevea brasiliensis TaxID=3981 RepID=A0ABQ9KEB8_HEVBR|nr:hypothetical protein P3X46_032310 [Hevea brasiliensis]KAJ9135236.1 hypothetical protein P3X46_032444 [Hevea brasiliensis]